MSQRDTIKAPPPDTMTKAEVARAELLTVQDRWLRARECLLTAEMIWGKKASLADKEGRYDDAIMLREHAQVMKMIRQGHKAEELYTL